MDGASRSGRGKHFVLRRVVTYGGGLVAGTVLTVLVSWRFAYFPWNLPASEATPLAQADAEALWSLHARGPLLGELTGNRHSRLGVRTLSLVTHTDAFDASDFEVHTCTVSEFGWPLHALQHIRNSYRSISWPGEATSHAWILPATAGRRQVLLPLRPLWGGLIPNAIFFSLALVLLGVGGRAIVRRGRLDERKCSRCSCDLSDLRNQDPVGCPACGRRIPTRLLRRSRQILRLWMAPLVAAPTALCTYWFLFGVRWDWTRLQLLHEEPLISNHTVPTMLIGWGWLFALCLLSYRDRSFWQRLPIALVLSTTLSIATYVSLTIIILRVAL